MHMRSAGQQTVYVAVPLTYCSVHVYKDSRWSNRQDQVAIVVDHDIQVKVLGKSNLSCIANFFPQLNTSTTRVAMCYESNTGLKMLLVYLVTFRGACSCTPQRFVCRQDPPAREIYTVHVLISI